MASFGIVSTTSVSEVSLAEGPLLTTEQLAAYLGISVTSVYQRRHRGDFVPALVLGRTLRFRERDVVAWLAEHLEVSQ